MTRPPLPRRLQGAALIMALLIMALATTLATTLVWHEDAWLQQVATRRELASVELGWPLPAAISSAPTSNS